MLAPKQIRSYQFQSAGEGLYRADEVDAFFGTVGSAYEKIYNDNGDMIKRINMLADKVKAYKEEEELIKKTLLVAQKQADELEETSKRKSEALVASAQKQAQEKTAAAEKRSKDLLNASEDRARVTLADANQKAAAILKGASETAENTLTTARNKAAMMLSEAKSRAEKMLTDAQSKSNEILGSIKSETESEKKALESVRAQTKAFKQQLLDSYDQQRIMALQTLGFVDAEDSVTRNAVQAAAAVTPIAAPAPIELPEEPAIEPSILPIDTSTYSTEDDDLFIATFAETVDSDTAEEPAAEAVEPQPETTQAPAEDENDGFSFVQSFDALMSEPEPVKADEEEIPEVELADIDEIFSSALAAPADPEPQEPEFDFVTPFDELKDSFSAPAAPQEPEQDSAFSARMQQMLSEEPEEPTQVVEPFDPPKMAKQPQVPVEAEEDDDDKPEKKHRRFSLLNR